MELVQTHQTECQPNSQKDPSCQEWPGALMRVDHSPCKHATGKHEEDTDHNMEPKLCGTGLRNFYLFLERGCGDNGFDGIPDERHPQCATDVR